MVPSRTGVCGLGILPALLSPAPQPATLPTPVDRPFLSSPAPNPSPNTHARAPPPGKEHLLTERERADIAYKRRVLELARERKRQLDSLDQERYQLPQSYGGVLRV